MRQLSLLLLVLPLASACQDRVLTGPEARRALAEGAPLIRQRPSQVVGLLNGLRLAPGKTLDGLDTAKVISVEILKGADSGGAEIRIITTDSAYVERVTIH